VRDGGGERGVGLEEVDGLRGLEERSDLAVADEPAVAAAAVLHVEELGRQQALLERLRRARAGAGQGERVVADGRAEGPLEALGVKESVGAGGAGPGRVEGGERGGGEVGESDALDLGEGAHGGDAAGGGDGGCGELGGEPPVVEGGEERREALVERGGELGERLCVHGDEGGVVGCGWA
jgi:hypothetical protein